MSEIDKYEAQKKKLQGICDENNWVFRFRSDIYPTTLTIRPVSGTGEQLSLLEGVETDYTSPDAAIVFSFLDGGVKYQTSKTVTISETLFNKIKNIGKKMNDFWLQYFFRTVIESRALRSGMMPAIDEDDAPDCDDPDEGDDDPESSTEEASEEAVINEAIKIVRLENKASVPLLQRRLSLGYSTAARLMEELERRGVVGPYNGGEAREVLPTDMPED